MQTNLVTWSYFDFSQQTSQQLAKTTSKNTKTPTFPSTTWITTVIWQNIWCTGSVHFWMTQMWSWEHIERKEQHLSKHRSHAHDNWCKCSTDMLWWISWQFLQRVDTLLKRPCIHILCLQKRSEPSTLTTASTVMSNLREHSPWHKAECIVRQPVDWQCCKTWSLCLQLQYELPPHCPVAAVHMQVQAPFYSQ
jgi:hypothetical protein